MIINRYYGGNVKTGIKINGTEREYTVHSLSTITAGNFVWVQNTTVYQYDYSSVDATQYTLGVATKSGTGGETVTVYVPS